MKKTSDRQILDILAVILQRTPETADPLLSQIRSLVKESGRNTAPDYTALHCAATEETSSGRAVTVRHCTRRPGTCDGNHIWSGWSLK